MYTLKILGFALIAALAMSAMAASTASAQTLTPTEGTTTLHGFQLPNEGAGKINAFTTDGSEFTCATGTFDVATAISGPVTEIVTTPTYSGCRSGSFFVTITTNNCVLRIYHTTKSGTHFTGTLEISQCPPGKGIETHVYSDSSHLKLICTEIVFPQTINGTVTLTNHGTPQATNSITIEGTLENITATRASGGICGFGTHAHFTNAVYHFNVTVTGQSHVGSHRGIHIG